MFLVVDVYLGMELDFVRKVVILSLYLIWKIYPVLLIVIGLLGIRVLVKHELVEET